MYKRRTARRVGSPDYVILISVALLTIFGLLMLASASSNLGKEKFGDPYYYLKHQLIYGLGLGIIGFLAGSLIYYRLYDKISLWLLFATIILLIIVFTPLGINAKGATRWVEIGPVIFQPSEIAKLTFILYLASWLARRTERQKSFIGGFLPFLLVVGIVSWLLIMEPSTSTTAILILVAIVMYFASGAKISYIFGTILAGILLLAATVFFTKDYRLLRIVSFLDPQVDIEQKGYHLNQAQIAIGSGGLFGVGYGESTTKLRYLPEPVGDSIFAVIAEEFGFVGSSVMIAVFAILILRVFILARRHPDRFASLTATGFGMLLALQTFIHIGAISGLLPLTGTPLPFISYGGTAMIANLTMAGIIGNMSKYA